MDRTETTIALDDLERQALPAAEYAVGQYLEQTTTNVIDMTPEQYRGMIEACVLTWKARYATLCELHDDIPFGEPSPADKKYETDDQVSF